MRRPTAITALALALVALALALAACGGDDENPTTKPAPSESPGGGAAPPGALDRFPPQFIQCLKDRGVDVESLEGEDPNEIFHGGAVPPDVLNACFGVLHGGGGAP